MKFDYTPKIQKIEDILDDFLPDLENSKNDALWQELNFSQLKYDKIRIPFRLPQGNPLRFP